MHLCAIRRSLALPSMLDMHGVRHAQSGRTQKPQLDGETAPAHGQHCQMVARVPDKPCVQSARAQRHAVLAVRATASTGRRRHQCNQSKSTIGQQWCGRRGLQYGSQSTDTLSAQPNGRTKSLIIRPCNRAPTNMDKGSAHKNIAGLNYNRNELTRICVNIVTYIESALLTELGLFACNLTYKDDEANPNKPIDKRLIRWSVKWLISPTFVAFVSGFVQRPIAFSIHHSHTHKTLIPHTQFGT